jgi:hypothetical protein
MRRPLAWRPRPILQLIKERATDWWDNGLIEHLHGGERADMTSGPIPRLR